MMTGFETGMVGYGLFTSVYGADSLSTFAAVDLGQLIIVWTVLIAPLMRLKTGRDGSVSLLKLCFTSPVVIGILLGLCAALLGHALPGLVLHGQAGLTAWSVKGLSPLWELISLLSGLTMPLICLAIGYDFSVEKKALRLASVAIGARLVILSFLGLGLGRFLLRNALDLGPLYERALLAMFILPPPFVYTLFLRESDDESRPCVSSTLSLHTAVSLLVFLASIVFIRQVP